MHLFIWYIIFYFYNFRNSIHGSAVCAFSMNDVVLSFEGPFKAQNGAHSTWLPVNEMDTPKPHPAKVRKHYTNSVAYFIGDYPWNWNFLCFISNDIYVVYFQRELCSPTLACMTTLGTKWPDSQHLISFNLISSPVPTLPTASQTRP